MNFKLDNRFKNRAKGLIEKYSFEVGVLEDGPHLEAKTGKRGLKGTDVISEYAGGPVRQKSRNSSGLTISDVSAENRKRLGKNYLTEPFKDRSSDIVKFSEAFFKMVFGMTGQENRIRNLLQAIVRNPILRGDYGKNSALTKKIKGFDRSMIDTAQLFKAIKARITRR